MGTITKTLITVAIEEFFREGDFDGLDGETVTAIRDYMVKWFAPLPEIPLYNDKGDAYLYTTYDRMRDALELIRDMPQNTPMGLGVCKSIAKAALPPPATVGGTR